LTSSSFFSLLESFFLGDCCLTSFCSSMIWSMGFCYFLVGGRYSSSSPYFGLDGLASECGLAIGASFASIFLGSGGEALLFKFLAFSTAVDGRSLSLSLPALLSFLCLSIFFSRSISSRLMRSSIWSMLCSSSSESSEEDARW
jgi:hypothetical protein